MPEQSLAGIPEAAVQSWGTPAAPWADIFCNRITADGVNLGDTLRGTTFIPIGGVLFSRSIGGQINVPKSVFPVNTIFSPYHTVAVDLDGSIAVYIMDTSASEVLMRTVTTSYLGGGVPRLLGNVDTNAGLPLTIDAARILGWLTPQLDDYSVVMVDETMGGARVEWYVIDVAPNYAITWGNPIPINAADYQAQSTAVDSGKLLVGGADPGTFGASRTIVSSITGTTDGIPTEQAVSAAVASAPLHIPDSINYPWDVILTGPESVTLTKTGYLRPYLMANNALGRCAMQINGRTCFDFQLDVNVHVIPGTVLARSGDVISLVGSIHPTIARVMFMPYVKVFDL